MKKTRKFRRRLLAISAIGVGSIFLLISVFFASLQTESVREKIRKVATAYAKEKGVDLSIESIEGGLPFSWTIHKIVLKWSESESLKIEKAEIGFDFFALFRRAVSINSLLIREGVLSFSKASDVPAEEQMREALTSLSSLPWNIRIRTLKAPHFQVVNRASDKSASYDLSANVLIKNRGRFFSLLFKLSGTNSASLFLQGQREEISGNLTIDLNETELLSPFFTLPQNEKLSLPWHAASSFTLIPEKRMQVKVASLELESQIGKARGENLLLIDRKIQEGALSFEIPDLKLLSPFQGSMQSKVVISEGKLEGRLESSNFRVVGGLILPISAQVTATQSDEIWRGRVDLTAKHSSLLISAESLFNLTREGALNFEEILIRAPETQLGGSLSLHLAPIAMSGSLFGHSLNLSHFRPLFPKAALEGSAGLECRFISAIDDGTSRELGQQLQLHLQLRELHVGALQATDLSIDGKASHLFGNPAAVATIEAEQLRYRDAKISSLSASTSFEEEAGSFEVSSAGEWEESFELNAAGKWKSAPEGVELTMEKLSGFMRKNAFFLKQPFTCAFGGETFKVSDFKLHGGQGFLEGDLLLNEQQSSIRLAAEHFPLELLALPKVTFKGPATFDGYLQGTREKIEGRASLVLEEAVLSQQGKRDPLRTKGTLLANVDSNQLQVHAHLRANGEQFLELTATLPLEYGLSPYFIRINREKPIASELTVEGEVEEIFDFMSAHTQRATGKLSARLFLSHTLASPRLFGSIEVENGSYENYFIGTDLREISAAASASGRSLDILFAKGKDAQGGTIDARGVVYLQPDKRFPYRFEADLTACRFINFDTISAQFTGPVVMEGDLNGALVKGTLNIAQANLNIPERLPMDLPVLPMTFINEPPHIQAFDLPPIFPLKLDLNLSAPGKIYIRGKGLNSEWQGDVHLKGTNMIFTGSGTLTLVKGEYEFAGKVFELTQGEVAFTDKANLSSHLNLTGTLALNETTIFAHLRGPVLSPTLTFESLPHLPTSSLLSLILFNKDISEISPFQAIQIAQTIVSMSGGAGPNVLEAIRKSLGVDRLSIISGQEGSDSVSVQIGKYLTRGVLVTLVQGTSSSQVQVEVDLKNGFVLIAETQEEEEGKFTLKWNKNY
ncbi:MAG: translocation/assembly module TamB domain-containing protein [Chlamydiales bacterium]|nr:translocation/assembly module TamB domain-containing protein [Chlamydiales bacterium]